MEKNQNCETNQNCKTNLNTITDLNKEKKLFTVSNPKKEINNNNAIKNSREIDESLESESNKNTLFTSIINLKRRNKKIKLDKNSNSFLHTMSKIKCTDGIESRKSSIMRNRNSQFYNANDFVNTYFVGETNNDLNNFGIQVSKDILYENKNNKIDIDQLIGIDEVEPMVSEAIIKQTDYSELLDLTFFNDIADIDCLDFLRKKKSNSFFDSKENIEINNIIKNQILEISTENKNSVYYNCEGLSLDKLKYFND